MGEGNPKPHCAGGAATTITDSHGTGIGLGDTVVSGGLNVSASELQRVTATGLMVQTAGSVTVDNVTAANSDHVAGTLVLAR